VSKIQFQSKMEQKKHAFGGFSGDMRGITTISIFIIILFRQKFNYHLLVNELDMIWGIFCTILFSLLTSRGQAEIGHVVRFMSKNLAKPHRASTPTLQRSSNETVK
jgi:hypothetical protein